MQRAVNFQDGLMTYMIDNGNMVIGGEWIIREMLKFGLDVTSYSVIDCDLILYGECPNNRILEIKKFIHDNYPYTLLVYPGIFNISVEFSIPINLKMDKTV